MKRRAPGKCVAAACAVALAAAMAAPAPGQDGPFRRIATFPAFLNTDEKSETLAEIVASAFGGTLLVYTDSESEVLGLVDITDPANPLPGGAIPLGGSPTSVAVRGNHALVCVNTSADFVNTSGELVVIDLTTRTIAHTIQLGGQPDSIAISPDQRYAGIAIENERDEDFGDGEPPQAPGGFFLIVDLVGAPAQWTLRKVDLAGIPTLFPDDPETEYVDINERNVAVITLQENNHVVLVDLASGAVIGDFEAGAVDLDQIDTNEDRLITLDSSLRGVVREPDSVVWTGNDAFATANEGDLFGGSRGFTIWHRNGSVLFDSGSLLEHVAARHGHYPEDRAENAGVEIEGLEYARYGSRRFLFAGSERAHLVFVFELIGRGLGPNRAPKLLQVLPTGHRPEGLHAIPERNLFVVANETDDRGAKIRASVGIYSLDHTANHPDVVSALRNDGTPIPWGAMSGLVQHPRGGDRFFAVHDSAYAKNRIWRLEIDVDEQPSGLVFGEIVLADADDVLLDALTALKAQLPGTDDFDPAAFVNPDGTVNVDVEGVDAEPDGTFWLAIEGGGNLVNGVSDPGNQPFVGPNMLLHVAADGVIEHVVFLPLEVTKNQFRFGFEGIVADGGFVYVCFQRAWANAGDAATVARIGRYELATGTWGFVHYPLDAPTSPNGGWVGLSELSHVSGLDFGLIERDDQGGPDARIKRLTRISLAGVTWKDFTQVPSFDVLTKSLAVDLIASGAFVPDGGFVLEKLEGMAIRRNGDAIVINDNDGLDDNNGETQLFEFKDLFD